MSIIFTGGNYPDKSLVVFQFSIDKIPMLVYNTPVVTGPHLNKVFLAYNWAENVLIYLRHLHIWQVC